MKKLSDIKNEYSKAIKVGWFLALRQIKHSGKGTTGLIIFIMVLTFLNLVVVYGLLVGLIAGSFKQFSESYAGDVIITSSPGWNYIENSSAIITFLENNPDVENISPRYGINVQLLGTLNDLPKKNERTNKIGIRLTGIDPEKEEAVTHFSRFIKKGTMLEQDTEGYILIGSNMIKKYSSFADANIPGLDLLKDVDVGSRVRVSFSLKDGNMVAKDFIVRGIVKSKVDEISTRAFILDKELRRMLPVNQGEVQEIAVITAPGMAEKVASDAKSFMGEYSARIQTATEAIPSFLRNIETTMTVLGNALSSFALVVASITIFIVIFINAVTKRKSIGIMKGIGISPLSVQFSYVFQAFFYGITGSAIGLFLTFGILKPYFDANPINFPFSDGILIATPEIAAVRVFILLIVTLIAGYVPAKIIIRKNTLDSILGRN